MSKVAQPNEQSAPSPEAGWLTMTEVEYGDHLYVAGHRPDNMVAASRLRAALTEAHAQRTARQQDREALERENALLARMRDEDADTIGELSVGWVSDWQWADEFVAWYDKSKWFGSHRAASAFLWEKVTALRSKLEAAEREAMDLHAAATRWAERHDTERSRAAEALAVAEELLALNAGDECCATDCQSACCGINHEWVAEQRKALESKVAAIRGEQGNATAQADGDPLLPTPAGPQTAAWNDPRD